MSIKVGDKAPSFVLPGTGGASYALEQFADGQGDAKSQAAVILVKINYRGQK